MRIHRSILISGIILLLAGAPVAFAADASQGKSLATTCVACHGEDGNSLAGSFPSIAGQNARYLLKQMTDIKSGARSAPLMAGMLDNLDEAQLADIAAFYSEQTAKVGAADPTLVAQGEAIYRAGISRKKIAACTACHSPTGQGNAPAGFPTLSGQWPEYTVAQLKAFRSGDRSNDGDDRMMRLIAMDMSDDEIAAVASYVYGLH